MTDRQTDRRTVPTVYKCVPGLMMMRSRSARLGVTVAVPTEPASTTSTMRSARRLYIQPSNQPVHPPSSLLLLSSTTTWVSRYQKGKTSLDLNEARDDGVLGCSGISWTVCKQSAPRSRQITTPTRHQSISAGWMPNRQCQSTEGSQVISQSGFT